MRLIKNIEELRSLFTLDNVDLSELNLSNYQELFIGPTTFDKIKDQIEDGQIILNGLPKDKLPKFFNPNFLLKILKTN